MVVIEFPPVRVLIPLLYFGPRVKPVNPLPLRDEIHCLSRRICPEPVAFASTAGLIAVASSSCLGGIRHRAFTLLRIVCLEVVVGVRVPVRQQMRPCNRWHISRKLQIGLAFKEARLRFLNQEWGAVIPDVNVSTVFPSVRTTRIWS